MYKHHEIIILKVSSNAMLLIISCGSLYKSNINTYHVKSSTNTLQFDSYELRIYKITIRFDSIRTNFTNYELFVDSIGALV
jgi:hypothetical protein